MLLNQVNQENLEHMVTVVMEAPLVVVAAVDLEMAVMDQVLGDRVLMDIKSHQVSYHHLFLDL